MQSMHLKMCAQKSNVKYLKTKGAFDKEITAVAPILISRSQMTHYLVFNNIL